MLKPKRHRQLAEINVVPYIDVMLVLLVIFMVTAPLIFQGVNVNLPEANSKLIDQKSEEPIVLSISANGSYYLNIAALPTQQVLANDIVNQVSNELRKSVVAAGQRQVLIKGDKNINYGKVIQAMTLLQQAGANNIGLITQPEDKP
jgi:biopolymer transport protein TolR